MRNHHQLLHLLAVPTTLENWRGRSTPGSISPSVMAAHTIRDPLSSVTLYTPVSRETVTAVCVCGRGRGVITHLIPARVDLLSSLRMVTVAIEAPSVTSGSELVSCSVKVSSFSTRLS